VLIDGRPPKILILGEAAAVHAQRWVGHFRRRGWTVRWLSLGAIPSGVYAEPLVKMSLPRLAALFLSVRRLRRIVRTFAPDVISALFLPDYGWLATMAGVHPLVVSAWGSDILIGPAKSRWHRRRIQYVLARADRLVADAELLRECMIALGAAPERIAIVPLGVDDEWLTLAEQRSDTPASPLTVISCRRQEPLYRVETLVTAAAQIVKEKPGRARFVIIGYGSRHDHLLRLAAQTGCADHITFKPWLPAEELREQFARSEIYVSTSSSDGTSVSLLEAMAAGCLPIVTDLPANREWVEPGVNGLVFPVGDASALAEQIHRAVSDTSLRTAARTRNAAIVAARARWCDNMAQMERLMTDLIAAHSPAGGQT